MTDSGSVCAELCCASCCVAALGCLQQWCFLAPCGVRRSRGTTGCCNSSFGGFDKDEDDITKAERKDKEKQQAKEAEGKKDPTSQQPSPHPTMILTPPTPVIQDSSN
ncbi:uncharacterized protein EI90DRAFT_3059195, partial [Cantharellus anzutake]|uniref:uncharacterized protein n=1 Tax=Cantharellus anzutake TaxID=1750568 RepID=UPI001905DA8A